MKLKDVSFWPSTKDELVKKVVNDCIYKKPVAIYTILDAASFARAKKGSFFEIYLSKMKLVLADGYYVFLAAKLLRVNIKQQITGYDLTIDLIRLANSNNLRIYFLGSEENVVKTLVNKVSKDFSPSIIAGFRNGYFSDEDMPSIINNINESNADILLIGMASPMRERFISYSENLLNISAIIPVGGVFDILGGKTCRAPSLIIKLKLEWFYRFMIEPRRMWRRLIFLYPLFVYKVLMEMID